MIKFNLDMVVDVDDNNGMKTRTLMKFNAMNYEGFISTLAKCFREMKQIGYFVEGSYIVANSDKAEIVLMCTIDENGAMEDLGFAVDRRKFVNNEYFEKKKEKQVDVSEDFGKYFATKGGLN